MSNSIIGLNSRAYGVDVSWYEPDFNPDNAQQGLIDFGIAKASEGGYYKDTAFEILYPQISKLKVNGAYHYLRSGISDETQANFFLNTVANKQLDILAIDFETTGNVLNDAFVTILYNTLLRVERARSDCKVMLYTNPDLYDTIIYSASVRLWGRDVFTKWDLWIAQYYNEPSPDKNPAMPRHRADWAIWQYSDKGVPATHGSTSWVDINVFNGSLSDMTRWLGTNPYSGVSQEEGILNGQKYYLQTINLDRKIAKVRHFDGALKTAQYAAQTDNAQIVVNGDDYTIGGAYLPTGMSYVNGRQYTPPFETRYWLNISRDNILTSGFGNAPSDVYNLTSFIRPLVVSGVLHSSLFENKIENTEIHARSILGISTHGELMILICEGFVNPDTGIAYAGVTLPQAAQLMIDKGAAFAGEHGGGGDAQLYSLGIMVNESSDRDAGETWRGVVQVLEIFIGDVMIDYYKIIGNDGGNHTIRKDYGIHGDPLYYPNTSNRLYITNTIGAESGATDADIHVYAADVPDSSVPGGYAARAGDTWRRVHKVGNLVIDGWTAEIHLGVRQGITIIPVTIIVPPPPTISPVVFTSQSIDFATKTMTITRKREDGTIDTLTDPIA